MSAERLDEPNVVKAMAHPLRVRIIALLQSTSLSAAQLAQRLEVPVANVSYHVKTLERLGLLDRVPEQRSRRPGTSAYRAKPRLTVSSRVWAEASRVAKEKAVASSLELIDERAKAAAAGGGFDREDAQLTRTTLRLDEEGWQQLSSLLDQLLDKVDDIAWQAARRLDAEPHSAGARESAVVMMLFEAAQALESAPVSTEHERGYRDALPHGADKGEPEDPPPAGASGA